VVGRGRYKGSRNSLRPHRDVLFLSHANPEDDLVTGWLALQLAREGYAVWCDLTKLLGGEAFWDDIQEAIEYRTAKFLYVLSRNSNSKDGPLAELTVARDVERKLKLRDFIIPLHIDHLPHNEMHILLRRLNTIPFRKSWAAGLNQLVEKLQKQKVPKKRGFGPRAVNEWWKSHFSAETGIQRRRAETLSNYFDLEGLPEVIYIHALTGGHARDDLAESLPYSALVQGDSLIAFAPADDFAAKLGDGRIWNSHSVKLEEFLPDQQNRNHVYTLLRLAWEKMAESKGLKAHPMSVGKAFWFAKDQVLKDRVAFSRPDGSPGYRSLVGYSSVGKTPDGEKRVRYWHYAVRPVPNPGPAPGFWIKSHVLFSDDGRNIWTSPGRLHAARRSQCSDWWNDLWRDRLLTTMSWLAGDEAEIAIPLGRELFVRLSRVPTLFESPVSYIDPVSAQEVQPVDEYGPAGREAEDAE
jgi:hypothetical protein